MLIINACSQYKPMSCPDHSKNKYYSSVKKNYPKASKQFRNKKYRYLSGLNKKNKLSINKSRKKVNINNNSSFESGTERLNDLTVNINSILKSYGKEEPPILIASGKKNSIFTDEYKARNLNEKKNISDYADISFKNQSQSNRVVKKEFKNNLKKVIYNNKNKTISVQQATKTAEGLAIASLVTGIVGFFVFGIPLGILATIFGAIALSRTSKNPELSGKGLAIAGLILGIVDIIGALIAVSLIL